MATKVKATVIGGAALNKKLDNLPFQAKQRLKVVLDGGATMLREDMKRSMASSPATGRQYGDHVASSAGNPPRIDTGALVNAVTKRSDEDGNQVVGVFKESGEAQKAIWLEFGNSLVEARPFAEPSYIRVRPKIIKNAILSLNNYLKTL